MKKEENERQEELLLDGKWKISRCENRHRNEERGREERNQVFFLCLKGAAELRVTLREFFMCSECKAVG